MFFRPKRLLIVTYVNTTYPLNALKSLLLNPGSELLRLHVVLFILSIFIKNMLSFENHSSWFVYWEIPYRVGQIELRS